MRKVVVYIAMSLDGYIADKDKGVAWLAGDGSDDENPGSYPSFIETIDTVILGYKTYDQIVTELSPGNWIYKGKISYIITHKKKESSEEIIFTNRNLTDLIMDLKAQDGKDIWICGGASIVNQLVDQNLIDRFHITVIPTILGDGVRLFEKHNTENKLCLISTEKYNGMVDLVYEPRKQ